MLDTLKIKVPLSEKQHRKITQRVTDDDRPQWVLMHPKTGEIDFLRVKGLAETDQHSYHRQIMFDVPLHYIEGQTFLVCEFSVPKFHYGHNVSLLYGWLEALRRFKLLLERQFGLTSKRAKLRLAEPETWEVLRADICYAFQFPSQRTCHQYLESLKHISYPRKKPVIYPEAILFTGATYSLKIYEKQPEFRAHDARELAKARANPDWVNYLDQKAAGVLRVEATLRRQYLKINDLTTVAALARPDVLVDLSEDWMPGAYGQAAFGWLLHYHKVTTGVDLINSPVSCELIEPDIGCVHLWLDDDSQPIGILTQASIESELLYGEVFCYIPNGRKAILECRDRLQEKLQFFLERFMGGCAGMQTIDQIRSKLSEHYKPAKVGRLAAFWLYVRRFGTKDAKEQFGHNSYYVSRRELKKLDISLVEPAENIIPMDKDFVSAFRLQCPSEYVSNRVDDFSNGDNLLNLPIASN